MSPAATARAFAPAPVIEWTDVLAVEMPGKPATRARLRRLVSERLITSGVEVARRGEHGMEGRHRYHSVLAAWAARMRNAGLSSQADELSASAAQIEARYGIYLRAFLAHHPLDDLAGADFYGRLVRDTADALAHAEAPDRMSWAVVPREGHDLLVWLTAAPETEPRQTPRWTNELPAHFRVEAKRGRAAGSPELVFLIRRPLGSGALTEVEPAVAVPTEEELQEGPPFTEVEYAELAARYKRAAASTPTAAERAALQRDATHGELPRRKVRPSS